MNQHSEACRQEWSDGTPCGIAIEPWLFTHRCTFSYDHSATYHECGCRNILNLNGAATPPKREKRRVEYAFEWLISAWLYEWISNAEHICAMMGDAGPTKPRPEWIFGAPLLTCTCVYLRGTEYAALQMGDVRSVRYSKKECPVHGEGTD